ncbi:hypothetical protein LguiA_034340 [Lonicera macranthoides]
MRRSNGDSTLETINAAATAIASAETRVRPSSVQKRRWGSCWSIYSCFGSHNQSKRIGHANLSPEPASSRAEPTSAENPTQAPSNNVVLPFVAPPSSPASSLYSELPSAAQSPAGSLSFASISANMYSPRGPASIFAIGPYAHETQLVSPPVFSTFTTEPSTAPFTPPPESVHMTTPSSPEVPFARLLDPTNQNGEAVQRFPFSHYEFQSYQLYPGSPVGHLISPSSGISGSGTSSPYENPPGGPHSLVFQTGDPHQFSPREWGSQQGSGSLTPDAVGPISRDSLILDRQNSDVGPLTNSFSGWRNDQTAVDHRVSFEITAEEVVRCVEKKSRAENAERAMKDCDCSSAETVNDTPDTTSVDAEDGQLHQKQRSITLGSVKEFNFDNVDGGNSHKPNTGTDWWANEKEAQPSKNWSFFPMMQPGVS